MADKQPSFFPEQAMYFSQDFRFILEMGEDGVTDDSIKRIIGKAAVFDIGAEIADISFEALRLSYFKHFLGKVEADKVPLAPYLFQEKRHEYSGPGAHIQYRGAGLNIETGSHGFQPGFIFFRRFFIPGGGS